ncbi:SusC/RagA family TonB-linked outer membrane protein [Chitinophaga sp. CF418]|uniref:SusC/RagA family TonB-linked outer membrane protein n=1 Tax=Chitinophaga sp. CF418 TaxID=1855287 RepID=UPI00091F1447|nr:SusC/RagA family TonB-linked outer membrane protein [Chitinophaga sp. CF418]SHM74701.1 TonB-linked outer membrane protein, SusC/RagA family [Chitinophaga sp. CF418]
MKKTGQLSNKKKDFIITAMRLTFLSISILLTSSLMLSANTGSGQELSKRVSVSIRKGSLEKALKQMELQLDLNFAYDQEMLQQYKTEDHSFHNQRLDGVLTLLFDEKDLSFKEVNGVIVINTVKRSAVKQQQGKIQGKVTDEQGIALPGATVKVVGGTGHAISDAEGNFSLSLEPGVYSIEVSFISYKTQRIQGIVVKLDAPALLNVKMKADMGSLNEVVVVGYGTQKRGEVTSAVSTVRADNFNRGGIRSTMELIQGKVAGLNITKTQGNNPNAGASIQLRGVTSLTGTTTPLIVIDGIPGGNLDLLQQDDIESFNILKDGSAAAIYGTRGNAGVILITTKKGSAGEPRYEYNTYFQRDYTDKKPDFLTAAEFRQKIAEGVISPQSDLGGSTNMYDEIMNKENLSQYHNFSALGGSERSNYRASLYYNDFQGIAKENGRKQAGARLNINQKGLNNKLTMQVNMVANFNKANLLGGGAGDFEQAVAWNPTAPVHKADGSFYEIQESFNPVGRLHNRLSQRDQQTFSGDARLSLAITRDISASLFGSYLRDNYNDRYYRSMYDWEQRPGTSWQGMGYASKENILTWTKTLDPTINYDHSWGAHNITAVAGYSYQYSTLERFNMNNNGFTTDAFLDWNIGAGSAITNTALSRPGMGSFKEDNTLIAFFGRLNYAYKNRYFAQVILRREGSSRFGANNKWGSFPAASVGWTISQEPFMKDLTFINNLKLRVGYGVTGNQGIPNYRSLITLGTGGLYPQNGIYYQTYGASRNPNPNLRWEKKLEWNFGLDYELLNRRLSGALDIYSRETRDLLYNYAAQQPAFVRDGLYTNVGTIRNHGVEILISGIPVMTKDFQWSVDFTANSQFNKLSKLSNELYKATYLTFADIPNPGAMGPAIRLDEGGQVGNFYGKRFAGFTEDGKWLFYKADGSKAPASQINENDRTIIGNGVPKYNIGLNQTFRYKNFDLTMLFRGKFGFDILNLQEIFFGNRKYLPNNIFNSAFTKHAQLKDDPQYSDYYIEKGNFVKLDNLTLGYNFNLKSAYVRNFRMFISGRNLLTFTGYDGLDPELEDTGFTTGVDSRGFYPRTRSWTVGLNLGF